MTIDPARVSDNIAAIRERIAGIGGSGISLLAVTKTFPVEAAALAVAAGCDGIGENYAQELVAKAAGLMAIEPRPAVHFIGHIQSNKVRSLVGIVDVWETVDRRSIVDELARRAPGATVMVQVNVSAEASKSGCEPADAESIVEYSIAQGLVVTGLMTIGRAGDGDATRAGFRQLRTLADRLGLVQCSMGMSDDFELAVQEGSTQVRLGSALFGQRVRP